jgi:hypothetical protein
MVTPGVGTLPPLPPGVEGEPFRITSDSHNVQPAAYYWIPALQEQAGQPSAEDSFVGSSSAAPAGRGPGG